MTPIDNDINKFVLALINYEAEPIACTDEGYWYIEGCFMRFIRWLFGFEDSRVANIARVFSQCLNQYELQPTSKDGMQWIKCADLIQELMKNKDGSWKEGSWISHEINNLKYRTIALKYRVNVFSQKEVESVENDPLHRQVTKAVSVWKTHLLMASIDKELTDGDKKRIKEICSYREFATHMMEDESIRERCFNAVIRTHNHPDAFIEFPGRFERIEQCNLVNLLGYHSGNSLRVHDVNGVRDLQLEFDNGISTDNWVSVLNEKNTMTLKNNVTRTVEEVFEAFRFKHLKWLDETITSNGVTNYNPRYLGPYNPAKQAYDTVDLEKEDWFKRLPRRFLSADEAKSKFGDQADGEKWIYRIMANRLVTRLQASGTHAYVEVSYPTGGGDYFTVTFGKYPTTFPQSAFEAPGYAARAHEGVIVSPDASLANAERQHAGVPEFLDEAEAIEKMNRIKKDIKKGLDGKMTYQFFVNNCAMWADPEGHYFNTSIDNSEPQFPCNYLFWALTSMSYRIQNWVFYALFAPFGGNHGHVEEGPNGEEEISLLRASPWMRPQDPNQVNPCDPHGRRRYCIPASAAPAFWETRGIYAGN